MKRYLCIAALISLAFAAGSAQARNYDCSKPGNANKAACKGKTPTAAAAKAAPVATKPAPTKTVAAAPAKATRNYDCSKPGNANKAVCKGASPAPAVVAAPAPKPAAAPVAKPAAAPKPTIVRAPASRPAVAAGAATGKCKDGTETHAVNHRGACSRHGGVAAWY
ncbi:DUF3761 domain-containing protein [Sphingomonas asaccharolytica]|uniref:DUF3761 domain-containing protein n=1 Tax=Sphingomonas asaccharolytica TaxID=40681 RepID=UPI00083313E7|nr:DUF3761 domain-containing protein [Sphingomonas asaccharolytica]